MTAISAGCRVHFVPSFGPRPQVQTSLLNILFYEYVYKWFLFSYKIIFQIIMLQKLRLQNNFGERLLTKLELNHTHDSVSYFYPNSLNILQKWSLCLYSQVVQYSLMG